MVNVNIAIAGYLPASFNKNIFKSYKSDLFKIVQPVSEYALTARPASGWEYTDIEISSLIPDDFDGDFQLILLNIPLEENWFSRVIGRNKIAATFYDVQSTLQHNNIPLENHVLRILYSYSLMWLAGNRTLPSTADESWIAHGETRRCIFDMDIDKRDIIYSCNRPVLCDACNQNLIEMRVSKNNVEAASEEIKHLRKRTYYRIFDFVKSHPVLSFILSIAMTVIIGVGSSLAASFLFEKLK